MKTQRKLTTTALYIALLLIEGTSPVSAAQNVANILTDKTTYAKGETVTATFSIDGTFYEHSSSWSIERWDNNTWVPLKLPGEYCGEPDCKLINFNAVEDCKYVLFCERPCWYIRHAAQKFEWEQTVVTAKKTYQCEIKSNIPGGGAQQLTPQCSLTGKVHPGKYTIKFKYGLPLLNPPQTEECDDTHLNILSAEKEILITDK